MYKLIAIDLDGTLLNSYGEVSLKNREAIKHAILNDTKVVIASGRDTDSVKKISLDLGINEYLIAGNGANIFNIKENKNIYENFLDKEKALKVIEICKNNSIFFNVYTDNGIITESINFNVKVFNSENNYKPVEKQTNIEIVQDIYEYIKSNYFKILKIIICDENSIIFNRIVERLNKINNIDVLDVEHMSKKVIKDGTKEVKIEYFYTEVTNKNANKWEAIKFLINKLDINYKEVICIGDNENDRKMIENAGMGVTMAESALASKNVGKYITDCNNKDGVAKAIYKFI